ncbi:DUF916 and DUF3324 domain-containing protein [Enterococcus sp. DIV0876]|uniref:DUF916 and DUF3324 domain-containing protein n=1 Tax=Enterococcus sp. DIV0876 TaxID=2774633 RepID=UPI003D300DF5
MKNMRQNCVFLILFIVYLCFFHVVGYAETTKFTVSPVLPQNQLNEASYFDLLVNKDTEQEIKIALRNTSSEELTVAADARNSYTTSTGLIAYQKKATAEDFSGVSFTRFVTTPHQIISLQPYEERIISFMLSMKHTEFAGEILGAFLFEEVTASDQMTPTESGTNLLSAYQYQIGIRMRQSVQSLPKPELSLIATSAVAHSGMPAIKSSISNNQPVAFGQISVRSIIRKKNNDTIIGRFRADNYQFAPHSVLELFTDFDQQALEVGTYTTWVELTSKQGTWVFEDTVEIDRQLRRSINEETRYAATNRKEQVRYYVLLFIIIILMSIILWLVFARRKRAIDESEQIE